MQIHGYIKNWLEKSGQIKFVHLLLLHFSAIRNKKANRNFTKKYPDFLIPPNSILFETGNVQYSSYFQSGREAAAEIHALCLLFGSRPVETILDWGCGTGRVTRHLANYFPEASITGIDANPACIDWLQHNIPHIDWQLGSYQWVNKISSNSFDLIIALSVLTHLPASEQQHWLEQLHSRLHTNGLIWLSTHGSTYYHQLTSKQHAELLEKGMLTLGSNQEGSRSMRTYHTYKGMQQLIHQDWELLLYYNGEKFPGILGGQDAWLIKKRA